MKSHLPSGGPVVTACCCEAGQYDEYGLPVPWSGVYRHPECPLHGGTRMDGKADLSEEVFRRFDLAQRGFGD